MKKQNVIEWLVLSIILVLIIPFLNVQLSQDGEELFNFFRFQIRYVNPISVIGLIAIQIWRKRNLKKE